MTTENTSPGARNNSLQPNIASMLCYLLMFVTCGFPVAGIVFIVIEKEHLDVRFHAWQSVFLGAATWILQVVLFVMSYAASRIWDVFGYLCEGARLIMWMLVLVVWVICLIKAYQQERWRIPLLGDLAAKQVGGL